MDPEITKLEILDTVPDEKNIPQCDWGMYPTYDEKYRPAFEVSGQEEADLTLLILVGHSLRFGAVSLFNEKGHFTGYRKMTWREAFKTEREALAWFALGKDVSHRVISTRTAQDFVWKYYRAVLPESAMGNRHEDMLERVHHRGEKAAKARGEVYWRKVQKLPPAAEPEPSQGSLFSL